MQCLAHFDNSEQNLANPDPDGAGHLGRSNLGRDDDRLVQRHGRHRSLAARSAANARTARLLRASKEKPPRSGNILQRAAKTALESDASMERLLVRVVKEVPQVDRICVSAD